VISRWSIRNFKAFREPADLQLGWLNIVAGPNSGGKSSVIQSMLLILQTLENQVSPSIVVLNGSRVRLGTFNDVRSDLGNDNAIHLSMAFDTASVGSRRMGKGLALEDVYYVPHAFGPEVTNVSCSLTMVPGTDKEHGQLQPEVESSVISVDVRSEEDQKTERYELNVSKASVSAAERLVGLSLPSPTPEKVIESLRFEVTNFSKGPEAPFFRRYLRDIEAEFPQLAREYAKTIPVGCVMNKFLPAEVALRRNAAVEFSATVLYMLLKPSGHSPTIPLRQGFGLADKRIGQEAYSIPVSALELLRSAIGVRAFEKFLGRQRVKRWERHGESFVFTISDLRTRLNQLTNQERSRIAATLKPREQELSETLVRDSPIRYGVSFSKPPWVQSAIHYLTTELPLSFHYLGPLRDAPRARYPLEVLNRPGEVGARGEQTAATLEMYRDRQVEYIPPAAFAGDAVNPQATQTVPLKEAVLDWLRYMGIAGQVSTRDRGKFGHEVNVATGVNGQMHDLTHVGVGVSQVLPIVVMCLLADSGSILILEQPELHLHPKVQTRLGDFLVATALQGKQCIVETHSEHLLNRVRLRIAADPKDELREKTKVYFVEHEGRTAVCREVQINAYGAIEDWPKDFFDQTEKELERIIMARTRKMQERATSKTSRSRNSD
jgi:predicted ATPase